MCIYTPARRRDIFITIVLMGENVMENGNVYMNDGSLWERADGADFKGEDEGRIARLV